MRKKPGFYIILLLGIGLIATSIVYTKGNSKDSNKGEINPEEDFIIVNEEEPYMEISRMEEELSLDNYVRDRDVLETFEENPEESPEEDEPEEEQSDDLNYTLVDSTSYMELESMLKPIDGELGLCFTNGNLIYSKTLEEWTNHNGIDILASEDTEIKAVLSGTVTEVYSDKLWGTVIIIDHGNGFLTKYANLSEGTMVMEGSNVEKGDTIGTIGQTAPIEMLEDPHLHFEVIEGGINRNPLDYLTEFPRNK